VPNTGLICSQRNDVADVVTPFIGSTLLGKTLTGKIIVALRTRCEGAGQRIMIASDACL
jgi:hypothetical protein